MERTKGATLCLVVAVTIAGCTDPRLHGACEWMGACDPVVPVEAVTVACDHSAGSTCTPAALKSTITIVLERIADRPGSTLEVWTLGSDLASTSQVASLEITAPGGSGARVARSHAARQAEAGLELLMGQVTDYFNEPPPSRSPLLAAIGKIALAHQSGPNRWTIIMIGDALVAQPGVDFECSPPTDTAAFRAWVQETGLLPPGSLDGATVIFAYVVLNQIDRDRCPVDLQRARQVRSLWSAVLVGAGADAVLFEVGPPVSALERGAASVQRGGLQ